MVYLVHLVYFVLTLCYRLDPFLAAVLIQYPVSSIQRYVLISFRLTADSCLLFVENC